MTPLGVIICSMVAATTLHVHADASNAASRHTTGHQDGREVPLALPLQLKSDEISPYHNSRDDSEIIYRGADMYSGTEDLPNLMMMGGEMTPYISVKRRSYIDATTDEPQRSAVDILNDIRARLSRHQSQARVSDSTRDKRQVTLSNDDLAALVTFLRDIKQEIDRLPKVCSLGLKAKHQNHPPEETLSNSDHSGRIYTGNLPYSPTSLGGSGGVYANWLMPHARSANPQAARADKREIHSDAMDEDKNIIMTRNEQSDGLATYGHGEGARNMQLLQRYLL